MCRTDFRLIGRRGRLGLIGNRIDIPLFPFVGKEFTFFGCAADPLKRALG
ncbi:MAG TPA: hypothetical protein VJ777_24440 [Mycobacterium sp.]|nr:hypothetical protein [Mycobacterium sp.]